MTTQRIRIVAAGTLALVTAVVGAAVGGRTTSLGRGGPAHFSAGGAGPVAFTGHLDRTAVLRGGDGLVRMELVIGAPDASPRGRARVPTDLVVVLDRSGSMGGQKIEHARAAVAELIGQLGPQDRLALVTYADGAVLTIPLAPADPALREGWLATVREIAPGGGTNMSSGLDLALAAIERARTPARVPRVVLVSDGLANQGDATPEGLVRRAAAAARGGYALTTVGVGADFNEYLMTALADAGTGNYHYLRGSEDLAGVFARELDAARTEVASGLAVRIEPGAGVQVLDAAGYPLERTGDAVVFRPGALFAGQERRVWVTLAVPHDTVATHDLGRFALSYDDGRERVTLALAETPRVACVAGEDEFYAGVDVPAWSRGIVVDAYNKVQEEVSREVKAGRREAAVDALRRFRDGTAAMNARLGSAPVATQLEALGPLEADVRAAFEGADQAAKQNELSKAKSAEALERRRAGSKR